MKTILRLLFLSLSVFVFSAMINDVIGQTQTAIITTDQPDYVPLSNAVFTGEGFAPNENVVLRVKNLTQPCNTTMGDSSYTPWAVIADSDGAFVTNWTVCNCPGDSLRLKATGQTSGLIAIALFTDAPRIAALVTVTPTSRTACIPSTGTTTVIYTVQATRTANGTVNGTYSVSGLPAGVTGSFSPASFTANGGTSFPSSTLTLTIASTATAGTTVFNVRAADGTDVGTGTGSLVLNKAPSFTVCPSDITTNTGTTVCSTSVTYIATASGTPTPTFTYTFTGATTASGSGTGSGSTFNKGTTNVTVTATNSCGSVECKFTVTVVDNQNPTISCPSNITQNNDAGVCGAKVTYTAPVGTDNCPGSTTTQTAGLASGSTFPVGTTTNTFAVTDASAKTATCSFTVTVVDNQNPTISCPSNITQSNDASMCGAKVTFTAPVGTDNCAGSTTTQTAGLPSGSTFPVGTTTNTFTVTDASGNSTSCSFTVTVNDTEAPKITCPSNITQSNDAGVCGAKVTYTAPIGTDNCAGSTTTQTAGLSSGSTFPVGTTTNTFTVTDASGNSTSCSFTITVNDTEVPKIACPDPITQSNDAGVCGAVVTYTAPVGTDNCAGSTTTQTAGLPSGSTFPVGTTTNTFTVTDASSNSTSCSFTVTVNDTEAPAITCPAPITQSNDAGVCGAEVTYTAPVGTDNCPGSTTTQTTGLASGSVFPVGTTTNTFTVTDASGNSTSCSFTVTVNDTEAPKIICPANITQSNDAGVCGAEVTYTAPVGTDNCPGSTTTQTAGLPSGSTFPIGTTTNTFTVTDASGNSTSCSFTVTVNDTEAPKITCPSNITQSNDAGVCGAEVTYTAPVGTDNCAGSTTTQTAGLASGGTFPVGTTTNTFTVTDASGNSTSCSFTVTVNDTEAPAITCPSNITQSNDAGVCGAVVTYTAPVGTDNCAGSTTIQTAGLPSGSTFPVGITTNTFTVTDASGNSTSCSFTVTVNDTEAPKVTCPSNITQSNDAGVCAAVVTYTAPMGTDNCAGSTTTQTAGLASGSTFPVGTTTNTFTVTDASGNSTSCSFTVTVNDTEAPAITCPSSITQNNDAGVCGAVVTYTAPVGTDNCAGSTTIQTAGLPSGSTFPVGITTNTFTVTDASGNSTSCSFTVTVNDTEAPKITCPSNITQSNDAGVCGAVVTYTALVGTDNCPGSTSTQTAGLASGSVFPVGTTTNTFTVTDASGNSTSCSFTVTVNDTEAPGIACPSNITQSNDAGVCGAEVTYTAPTGTDNCSGSTTTQTAGLPSGSTFPVGTTTNTFTVTDASGNSTSCSFTVTVNDTEAPVISCPSNITQSNDAGVCGAVVTFTAPVGTDNCAGSTTTQTAGLPSGSTFPVGTTTNTFTVTDASRNQTSCSFTVTVNDTEAPAITCPSNITQSNDPGVCGAVVTYTAPVGTDNCSGSTTTQPAGLASGSVFPVGITTNTFTVTDASGNSTSCSFTVTVNDTEAPAITCPSNITQSNDAGVCGAVVTYTAPVGTDNCAGSTTTQTAGLASGSTFPVGTTTNTFTVTDASGNKTSCSFTVTVTDNEAPAITCPSNITQSNDAGVCGAKVTYTAPVGTDNCPGSTTTQTAGLPSGSTFPVGTTTNTFKVTDASGNSTNCSFTVMVNDTEAPKITCKSGSPFSRTPNNMGCSYKVTGNEFDPTSYSDNCTGAMVTNSFNNSSTLAGATLPSGSNTIIWTVRDASGNTTSCTIVVNVTSTFTASCTNNNPVLYFGYTGDQTSTVIVKPMGGTGPYTVSVTMSRPLICNLVTTSGDEVIVPGAGTTSSSNTSCPSEGTSTTGNPTLTAANVGTSGYSFNATLMADAIFTATFTDALGCTTKCSTFIHADDVRCFAGNSGRNKVTMCHKTGSKTNPCVKICIDDDAVNEHLAHGDYFGACTPNCAPPVTNTGAVRNPDQADVEIANPDASANESTSVSLRVKVSPNPSNTYFTLGLTSSKAEKIQMRVLDIMGRVLEVKSNILPNGNVQVGSKLRPGTYIAEFMQGKQKVAVRLFKIYR